MGETAELHRLPARYIAQLVDYLESIGIDRGRLLRAARIRSIDTPKAQVTLRQVEALLRAAEQASGRMDLGFELGRRLNPTSHDVLGFALLTSPTFGHYLRLAVSYQRLIQPVFALTLQRRAGQVDLVYLPAVALPHRSMRVLEEAIVVSDHAAFQSTLGERLQPYDAWLSMERPLHAERYRELTREPGFTASATTWQASSSIKAALLDVPLAMANPRAMQCSGRALQVAAAPDPGPPTLERMVPDDVARVRGFAADARTAGGLREHLRPDPCPLPGDGEHELP